MFFLIVRWKVIYTWKDSIVLHELNKKYNDFQQNYGFNSNQHGDMWYFLHTKVVMLGPKLGYEYWQ
jgi:hypothetical protein